jgi:hypothetical protein
MSVKKIQKTLFSFFYPFLKFKGHILLGDMSFLFYHYFFSGAGAAFSGAGAAFSGAGAAGFASSAGFGASVFGGSVFGGSDFGPQPMSTKLEKKVIAMA